MRSLIHLDGVAVFVKQIPLTRIEQLESNLESTSNVFGLPLGCQYGVGSPSFGVWREVAANETVTDWTLSGHLDCFAAMYHWRVTAGPTSSSALCHELADIDRFVEHWHGSGAVRRRVEAIDSADATVTLFLEYIPTPLSAWLLGQTNRSETAANAAIDMVEACLVRDVHAMNQSGLFHFDAHFDNMVTDGQGIFFVDLGLALSAGFDLSDEERVFLAANRSHDVCHTITRLVDWLVSRYLDVADHHARDSFIEQVAAGAAVTGSIPASAQRVIAQYSPVAACINQFYSVLHGSDRAALYPTNPALVACNAARLAVPTDA